MTEPAIPDDVRAAVRGISPASETDYDTSTITHAEARLLLERLDKRVREHSHAAWKRGVHVDRMGDEPDEYEAARDADDHTRRALNAELELIGGLVHGLIEERSRSASALRVPREVTA